jgi:hypothetical protein
VSESSAQSGGPVPCLPDTDGAAVRLREGLRAVSTQVGDNADAFLAEVTMVINQYVRGTEHAGITLVENGNKLRSQSATGFCPLILDGIQQRCKCGPSFDLVGDQLACRIDDFSVETRWPTFVRPVLACSSIRTMLSFRLFHGRGISAILNLYGTRPNVFPINTTRIGEVLATESLRAVESTINGPLSRDGADPVEAATRILMNRYEIDKIAAYSLLVRLAKGTRHTVAAAACRLIQKGPLVDSEYRNSGEGLAGFGGPVPVGW